jgi:hypothetical protein
MLNNRLPINHLRNVNYDIRSTNSYVRKIHPFLTNKANLQKVKFNITKEVATDYENMDTWLSGKKQSQTNPNKANLKPISPETNPIQSQTNPIKANFTAQRGQIYPVQTQNEPKQTQSQNPIRPQRAKKNYLPLTLFTLTSPTARDYNEISSRLSIWRQCQMKGVGNEYK